MVFSLVVLPVFSADNTTLQAQGKACSAIAATAVRLACYDKLFLFKNESKQASAITHPSQRNSQAIIAATVASNNLITPAQDNAKRSDNAGKKYLASVTDNGQAIYLSLVKMQRNKDNIHVFYFENGQIWQQLEPSYLAKPKQFPITSRLTSGAFSSYNLRLGNKAKKIKVKRVK
ncbi:hypothetical protein [Colwellia chukchiensis]|nr:hypothetical protein [Colwellia chukchiensis]